MSELQKTIEKSDLSGPEKDLWFRVLEVIDDEQARDILDSVGDDPEELEAFTRGVKLKQLALADNDHALMDQIIGEEKEEFARL